MLSSISSLKSLKYMIQKLEHNQIFVFGSNLAGLHYGGAAAQAHKDFGAEWGVGEGLTGQCYAFPTLGGHGEKLQRELLEESAKRLINVCTQNPEKEFLLTAVGTGIAGHSHEYMKSLFMNVPKNLKLPEEWLNHPEK